MLYLCFFLHLCFFGEQSMLIYLHPKFENNMKKLFLPVALIATIVLSSVSCKKDSEKDAEDCVAAIEELSVVASAYVSDPSSENCNAYKNALQDLIGLDCTDATADAAYQAIVDGLTCL